MADAGAAFYDGARNDDNNGSTVLIMPLFRKRRFGSRRSHGATPRLMPMRRRSRFDDWLNRCVDVAVVLALLVGVIALVVHILL